MRRDERAMRTQRAVILALAEGPATAAVVARRAGISVGVARVYLGYMSGLGYAIHSCPESGRARLWVLSTTGAAHAKGLS